MKSSRLFPPLSKLGLIIINPNTKYQDKSEMTWHQDSSGNDQRNDFDLNIQ